MFGELITDPIETVQRIDTPFAILLGGLTFVTATVGINIVANFISPAFDFSNVTPQKISWRIGGMIAAVGSVLLTPWNWYGNADAIHYTLGVLGALIGPLFGILIAGYYLDRQAADRGRRHVHHGPRRAGTGTAAGTTRNAVGDRASRGLVSVAARSCPSVADWARSTSPGSPSYSWFIGCGLGFAIFVCLERRNPQMPVLTRPTGTSSDGTVAERTGAGVAV